MPRRFAALLWFIPSSSSTWRMISCSISFRERRGAWGGVGDLADDLDTSSNTARVCSGEIGAPWDSGSSRSITV